MGTLTGRVVPSRALWSAAPGRPGTRVVEVNPLGADFDWIRSEIGAARDAGADVVAFSIHWGPNMRETPPGGFIEFAHAVVDSGADIFHGHSAHLFQGIEIYRRKPIFYDTGELVDDYAVDATLRNDQGLIFLVTFLGREVQRIELVPILISDMQMNETRGRAADEIAARLARRSALSGTKYRCENTRIMVAVPEE